MSRSIKFRAWYIHENKFIADWQDSQWIDYEGFDGGNSFEVTQFTELLDKSGVEIFEGDIVEIYGTGKCVVSITPQLGVCFTDVSDKFTVECAHDVLMENDLGLVVGNIYENQEFLTNA